MIDQIFGVFQEEVCSGKALSLQLGRCSDLQIVVKRHRRPVRALCDA